MHQVHGTAREPAVGASRQLKLMKYTSELRVESIASRPLPEASSVMTGKGICKYSRVGFAGFISAGPIRVVPRAFRPFVDEGLLLILGSVYYDNGTKI